MPFVLAPIAGLVGLELALDVLTVGLVLVALALASKIWLEPLVAGLSTKHGSRLLRIIDIPGAFIRGKAAAVLRSVSHSITVAASHRMHPVARWFHAAGSLAIGASWAAGQFAADMAYGVERLVTVVVPREIAHAVRPVAHRATRAAAAALAAALAVRHLRSYVDRLYGHTIRPALHRLEHAVDVTIPRSLGRVGVRVRDLERDLAHPSTRWLRRTAAALWGAALLGLMIRTLARRFPWLFCRQVKNVGQRVCGLDPSLLESLLLDTLVIAGTVSVVELARELQGIETATLRVLGGFIDELDA